MTTLPHLQNILEQAAEAAAPASRIINQVDSMIDDVKSNVARFAVAEITGANSQNLVNELAENAAAVANAVTKQILSR